MRLLRALAYLWALPTTLIGLGIALWALATGGRMRLVEGVLEVHGGLAKAFVRLLGGAAVTLGHVVLGADARVLAATRVHERVHVRQCERWGPFFLPAYFFFRALIRLRGGDPYLENPFERQAFAEEARLRRR